MQRATGLKYGTLRGISKMARGYNKVILIGNMVRDAEMRGRESKVASFTIAVSRS